MKCIDSGTESGTFFSFKEILKNQKNLFNIIADMQRVLKLWRTGNLHLSCFFFFHFHRSKVPTEVDGEFQNMQKSFFMENFDPSI